MAQTKPSIHRPRTELAFSLAILFSLAIAAKAAISVQPTGTGVLPFNTLPPTTEWSSRHVLPNAGGAITTVEGLDVPVQTNTAAAINTALVSATGGANNQAAWHSTALHIYTRPTGNSYQLLMGQFRNDIGDAANQITISFNSTINTPLAGEAAGWRVFYNLSGQSNEWIVIPQLSGFETNGLVNATVNLASNWLGGNILYLLFADDNANGITDPGYTIDNFSMTATPTTTTPLSITNQPQSITVAERGQATFSVGVSGAPKTYFWFKNGVQVPGNNLPTYTIPSVASPGDNNAQIYVVVSNAVSFLTSSTATLTVTPDTTPPAAIRALSSPDRVTVTVTFSEPIDPGFDVGSFHYFQTGTDPDVTAIYPDTATLVNGSNIVLNFASDPLDDGVNYSVRIFDVFDTAAAGGNQIQPYPTILPLRRSLLLIDFDGPENIWKYSIQTNLFGTGWETAGYDDSDAVQWPSGPAGLGVDNTVNPNVPPIRTATAYPMNSSAPQFFRRHFFLPSSTNGVVLTMRHVFEDGGVVYLNGQEAGRYNVGGGVLNGLSRASGTRDEAAPPTGPVVLPLTNVFAGDNVIAVVVLQSGGASTDIELALELRADFDEFASGPPFIQAQPQSQTVTEGGNAGFSVSSKGALPLFYQWRKGGSPILGATNPTYSITGVVPADGGNYDVVVMNSLGTSNSAVAVLTVNADNVAPVILSAIGGTNLNTVVVTLYDAGGLNLTSAQTPSNYEVRLTAGGPDLTVTSAVATPVGTNLVVTLTTSTARTEGQNYTVTVNVRDRSVAQNPVTPNTAPIAATVIMVPFTQTWRYDQTGTDLGTAWKDIGYNDSAWLSGPGFLGFETTAGVATFLTSLAPPFGTNTVLSLTNGTGAGLGGTNITFYFRTALNIPNFDPATSTLTMRGYIDDGAIIYVNGTERLRINHSNAPTYLSLANAGSTESVLIVSNLTGLVQGNNLIAVEVHQNAMDSSDIVWGMQLEALVTAFSPGGPTLFTSRDGNNLTITWSGGGTLQRSSDIGSPANWQDIIGATSPFQTNTTAATLQFFRVKVP
jgi:hypothetical protein